MQKEGHDFIHKVFEELDMVWRTYIRSPIGIKKKGIRRERRPKLIHIYGGKDFYKELEKTLDSNPLMRIILDTIGKNDVRYYPIYSRGNSGYRRTNTKSTRGVGTFYDAINRFWDYENNQIDFSLDKVVGGYPPILTWLFVERPTNSRHGDLLIYFIKKWYASKKIDSAEASDGGTES